MRKRNFLWLGTIFLLVPLLTVGCGVAQEQYDSVVADLNKANQELQSVKAELQTTQTKSAELTAGLKKAETELETTQAKVSELTAGLKKAETENSELTSSLEKTQGELTATKSEYGSFKSEVKSIWDSFDRKVGLQWFIVGYWSAAAKGDVELIEELTAKMVSYVEPIGDSMLNSLWKQAMSALEKGQDTLFLESFAALMDQNSSLVKAEVKVIREKLAPAPAPPPAPASAPAPPPAPAPAPAPPPAPAPVPAEEAAETELANVQTAVIALMIDNNLDELPNPVTVATNDMGAFPDTSVCGVDKIRDPNGNSYTAGHDKDGYILFQHDIIGDGTQTGLVSYLTVRYTKGTYTIDAGGTVTQVTTGYE